MLFHNKRLMEARLGVYEKPPYEPGGLADDQSARLRAEGGHRQQERMIKAKRKTFDRVLFNSYQAAEISPVDEPTVRHRALINPNFLKQDYDDKILSVGYEHGYQAGDVFIWNRKREDNSVETSYWLIYLQDLTELAYFKGDIRKCNYYVNWENEKGESQTTWFAVRGPVETKINFIQKNKVGIDTPNHSLNILMPKTEETIKYFKRYAKFYIRGADDETNAICWRVEATDTISMKGVLEITAVEYYSNLSEDDVEEGIVGDLDIVPIPDSGDNLIIGQTNIKPKKSYTYKYEGSQVAEWGYDETLPLSVKASGNSITLTWLKNYSGSFVLTFGDSFKEIIVESLF